MDATENIKTMYIYTSVGEKDLIEAKSIIDDSISKFISKDITLEDKDIGIMKKIIKTSIAAILEDSEALGSYVLNQMLMNKSIFNFVNDLKKIDEIKVEDIYNVANKVLANPTIHILASN